MLDLQHRGPNLRISQQVQHQPAAVVAHTNALRQALPNQVLHSVPCALQRRLALRDVAVPVGEAGLVAHGRVDVLERNGEVDQVEVEVVDAPVLQLLLGDRRDALGVVERVPQLGDDEEVGALAEAVFNSPHDAFAGFLLVAVAWRCDRLDNRYKTESVAWIGCWLFEDTLLEQSHLPSEITDSCHRYGSTASIFPSAPGVEEQ